MSVEVNMEELFQKIQARSGKKKMLSQKRFHEELMKELAPLGVTSELKWVRGNDGVLRQEYVYNGLKVV